MMNDQEQLILYRSMSSTILQSKSGFNFISKSPILVNCIALVIYRDIPVALPRLHSRRIWQHSILPSSNSTPAHTTSQDKHATNVYFKPANRTQAVVSKSPQRHLGTFLDPGHLVGVMSPESADTHHWRRDMTSKPTNLTPRQSQVRNGGYIRWARPKKVAAYCCRVPRWHVRMRACGESALRTPTCAAVIRDNGKTGRRSPRILNCQHSTSDHDEYNSGDNGSVG